MKKFAAFDIDGTLYRDALYHDIIWELIEKDVLPKSAIHEFGAQYKNWKTRKSTESFNDFVFAHVDYFEKRLPQLDYKKYLEAIESLFLRKREYVYTYTRDLIKKLKQDGYFLVAISGSQIEIVERFAKHYGFDDWVGQVMEIKGNRFTGRSKKTYKGKEKFLKDLIKKHDLTLEGSIATGDSYGDIGMLEIVENPIAFNPEDSLRNHAAKHGWKIVVERKNTVYELEKKDGRYQLA